MSAWKDKLDNGEILLIDGAMGTELERRGVPMSAISWSGTSLVENPEEIIAAHEDYIRAGAEVIITNTFGVGPYLLEELGYADRVDELIRSAGELAQRARDNVGIDVAIAGSIADPGIRNRDWVRDAPEPGEQEMLDSAGRMATQLAAGGCDLIALEMMMDTVVATIGLKAAKATGLAVGTPVTAGTIDAAAEAVSVGVREPGDMMVMYGSTIFIVQVTETRLRDPRLWHGPWLFEGGYSSTSGLSTSGTLTHWFRDQLAQDLTVEAAFPELAAEAAASPPGAKGLVMLPYFSGERTPIHDPNAKGVLFGLNLTHTRGDIYRALLEGIAYATNHIFETYAEAGQVPKRVLAVGGGTKNEVWAQSTSNVSGIDQTLRRETIGASYGDAFLAALAVGDVRQGDIEAWNPETSKISAQPDESLSKGYSVFRRLYEQTKDLMAELE